MISFPRSVAEVTVTPWRSHRQPKEPATTQAITGSLDSLQPRTFDCLPWLLCPTVIWRDMGHRLSDNNSPLWSRTTDFARSATFAMLATEVSSPQIHSFRMPGPDNNPKECTPCWYYVLPSGKEPLTFPASAASEQRKTVAGKWLTLGKGNQGTDARLDLTDSSLFWAAAVGSSSG
jgi:hypothetical protein